MTEGPVYVADESEDCPHCGEPKKALREGNGEWLCAHCERWSDTGACPACGQPVRLSALKEKE